MPLDLGPIKAVAEDMMVDTIRIRRDPSGTRNEVFNRATGQYDPPPDEQLDLIYEGIGLVWAISRLMEEIEVGGQTVHVIPYGALLPISVDGLEAYDIVTVVNAVNDHALMNKVFYLTGFVAHTYNVVREVTMGERVGELYPR